MNDINVRAHFPGCAWKIHARIHFVPNVMHSMASASPYIIMFNGRIRFEIDNNEPNNSYNFQKIRQNKWINILRLPIGPIESKQQND